MTGYGCVAMVRVAIIVVGMALQLLLGGCASSSDTDLTAESLPLETLYHRGMDAMREQHYKKAITAFQQVERDYPFSPWAVRAQIMEAYASFEDQEYDTTVNLVDRFAKLHPAHPDLAYLHYLKAMCHYVQVYGSGRDQGVLHTALSDMTFVVITYPHSIYARDAQSKIALLYDYIAGSEMNIGRFYLKRHDSVAALLRFQYVVTHYPTTVHSLEALYRMVEVYVSLGTMDEATKYAAILGHNHPQSFWYQRAYSLLQTAPLLTDQQHASLPLPLRAATQAAPS